MLKKQMLIFLKNNSTNNIEKACHYETQLYIAVVGLHLLRACWGDVRAILLGLRETLFKEYATFKVLSSSMAYKRLM